MLITERSSCLLTPVVSVGDAALPWVLQAALRVQVFCICGFGRLACTAPSHKGSCTSSDFSICRGSWNQSSMDNKGHLCVQITSQKGKSQHRSAEWNKASAGSFSVLGFLRHENIPELFAPTCHPGEDLSMVLDHQNSSYSPWGIEGNVVATPHISLPTPRPSHLLIF